MFAWIRNLVRRRSGSNVLALFGLTILLPGLLLTISGVRALFQERRFAQQQVRERLERAAQIAVRDLERDLHQWQAALERIGQGRSTTADALPFRVRASIDEPGAGAVVFTGTGDRRIWPQRQVLYQLVPPPVATDPAHVDRALSEAESVELRAKDLPRAIVLYRRALSTAARDRRALILHRLARTLRKAGRVEEALARYRELAASSDRIGTVPADLLAQVEIASMLDAKGDREGLASAAFDVYRGLVDGRWVLQKPLYLFYAATAREWLTANSAPTADLARWMTIEGQKQVLTDAVTTVFAAGVSLNQAPDGRFLVIQSSGAREVALVVAHTWLSTHVWSGNIQDDRR